MLIQKFILTIFLTISFFIGSETAQTKAKLNLKDHLPRVGTIKDYAGSGMMTGCGNSYFVFPRKVQPVTPEYVFLARDRGEAWMNLDGRDTRLKWLRTVNLKKGWRAFYRAGTIRITVSVRPLREAAGDDRDTMIITFRRGQLARTIRLVGGADC